MPIEPSFEAKFTAIWRDEDETRIWFRLYDLQDGGLDADGRPLYARIRHGDLFMLALPPNIPNAAIVARVKSHMSTENSKRGNRYLPSRFVCALGLS